MVIFVSLFSLFLPLGAMAVAPNNCPQIQDAYQKACGQTAPDLCDLQDELMFRKLLRLAERTSAADRPQFEKYQTLLKGPAVRMTLKELADLQEQVSSCVMQTHSLWTLLLKQGATKASRKNSVQNLIQKKLLSPDLYNFTLESLRERVSLIQEAIALNLLSLNSNQSQKWKDFVQNLRQEKALSSEKAVAEKMTPAPVQGEARPSLELARLNELFVKIRLSHQKINEIFQ